MSLPSTVTMSRSIPIPALLRVADSRWPAALAHKPYVDALPPADQLTTPHYFSKSEKELLAGTNLQGAVETQDAEWRKEAAVVSSVLKEEGLTW